MIVRAPDVIIELHPGDPPPAAALQKERVAWNLLPPFPRCATRACICFTAGPVAAGPRLGRAAEALARVLHPEAFK